MIRKPLSSVAGVVALLAFSKSPLMAQQVTIDPQQIEVASWEGWGCSLSWWAIFSSQWNANRRQEICRRLFSSQADSLGFNIVRYNAGGTSPNADSSRYRLGGKALAILEQDGSWHLDRDAAQIECLRLAKQQGANLFELFSNSPPYWMLKNRDTRGGADGKENLIWDYHDDFADWLTRIARKFKDAYNLRFDFIEPFNEPSAWWWNPATSNQEGSYITWGAQARILKNLKTAIDRDGGGYGIASSDENGAGEAYNTLNWLTSPDNGNFSGGGLDNAILHKINVHSYNGVDRQTDLRTLADTRGTPKIWMSEVTHREWENLGFVPNDMRCALPLSHSIISDIRRLKCSAWVHWQPVEPLEYNLQYRYTYGFLPTTAQTPTVWNGKTYAPGESVIAKSYFAMMQFSRFLRPKDSVIASGDAWTLAAVSPKRDRLVLIVHNETATPKGYSFDLTRFDATGRAVQVWRTKDDDETGTYNCRALPARPLREKRFTDTIPPRSVTTYIIRGLKLQNKRQANSAATSSK